MSLIGSIFGCKGRKIRKFIDKGLIHVDGIPIRWDVKDLPITIIFHPLVDYKIVEAYREVRQEIADFMGRDVIDYGSIWMSNKWPQTAPRGCVTIKQQAISGAQTSHHLKNDKKTVASANVLLSDTLPEVYYYPVLRHEMGHVLGLAHDELGDSIMHPQLHSAPISEKTFTDKDKWLLEKIYS